MADTGFAYYQMATAPNATATMEISNTLRFAASKSIRTSTVILASFNALAAFATATGIIIGCRSHQKRMQQRRASDPLVMEYESKSSAPLTTVTRPSGLFFIHTVEIFPLVLSLGITIQSVTFAAAQSVGLQALLSRGCTITAIFMLPGKHLLLPSEIEDGSANLAHSCFYRSFYTLSLWCRDGFPGHSLAVRTARKMECDQMPERSGRF